MSAPYTHPEIAATFRPAPGGGYTSRSGGGFVSCPPYVIASVASGLNGLIDLPEGYDRETLEQIQGITGWVERDVHISDRQASELAGLGRQILALRKDGKADLAYFEQMSVEHLVNIVNRKEEWR